MKKEGIYRRADEKLRYPAFLSCFRRRHYKKLFDTVKHIENYLITVLTSSQIINQSGKLQNNRQKHRQRPNEIIYFQICFLSFFSVSGAKLKFILSK
jgi:hypothetical protein